MAVKHKVKPRIGRTQASAPISHTHPTVEGKDSKIDSEVRSAAGNVQEELTPIRRSAGHSHTH